jgi:protein-S-isoprenylcysteine O-methyltransferase Ste14
LENQPTKNLLSRLIRLVLITQGALAALLFIPGTLRYWQGWTFFAVNLVVTLIFCVYFYRHDRELLARRLLRKEKIATQRFAMFLLKIVSVSAYVVCGLDNRFGWTRKYLIPLPEWLPALALLGYAGCYLMFIPVFNANRFAATVIQVDSGQTVMDQGPYRVVRHPMYLVSLGVWFWIPLALGSLVAMPAILLVAPILVLRLLNEEKFLCRELPGYNDYCQRTRSRLIPFVW